MYSFVTGLRRGQLHRNRDKSVHLRTKCACAATYLQNCQTRNLSSLAVHLLEPPTKALCSNPGHQFKRHHVPRGQCACLGSSPVQGGTAATCFYLFFQRFWRVKSRATTHGNNCRFTAGLPIGQTHAKNQFFKQPEGLRQFRDHRWKALGGENSDLSDLFLFGHYFESYSIELSKYCLNKNSPDRFRFSPPRAFQRWSRNCRNPSGCLAN